MIVNNHQLFSHTYLARLQADPSHDEAAAPIAQGLRDWMPFRDTSSLQALIDSWIGPVLDFLEFHHVPADDAPHIRLLYARRGDETPIGLCYVVPPGQDLDDTTKGRHPMAQTVLALRAHDLRWGMLTDGARWRLVDAQALRRYEHYVEVDLDELARSDDPTPLRLFYALFHCSAFTSAHLPASGGTEGGGESGLDRLVTASTQATKAAEDHLKALVSHNEGIMAQLCLGLVRADGQARYTEAERDAIYRDATYLLYRILFILYAEARGLLPMDNPAYRAVSLAELVKTAYAYKLHGMPDPQAATLWDRLKRLCNAIYESDPVLGIPAYNGGLFDDADKPYLRNGHIADAYLTEALFDLAYMPDKVPGTSEAPGTSYRPIDYRDLSVRHLGSLYEGMIEYKLHMAEETLWARREKKGNVRFLCTGQDGAPRKTDVEIEPGQVYFSQSPGERRATGTYYTPEYIVDYIVSQTVWRGLEERRESLEEKLHDWLEEIQTSEVSETSEVLPMQRTADEELKRFVEEQVLAFHVCDPAMGSGHFLVNSAHQITNFIVETLHLTPWENPTVDADPATWRRQVVERCLYGVDLSLMAVELAKLSLWLASVAEGKPLSFLDHHLRQGNSLIGARLEDLAEVLAGVASTRPSRRERKAREAGQLSMLDDPAFSQHVTAAIDLLAQISARVIERVEDVKAQEADYEQVRTELEPYRRLADLWAARHFGVDVYEQQLHDISRYLVNGAVSPVPEYQRFLREIQELANERCFFHWEFEFPGVFLGQRDQLLAEKAGFDVMVGNPPYLRQERLSKDKDYFRLTYEVYDSAADLYVYFYERSHELLHSNGRFGMITSNKFMRSRYGGKLRTYLIENHHIEQIVDFGELPVFSDAATFPAILVTRARCLWDSASHSAVERNTVFAQIGTLDFSDLAEIVKEQRKLLPPMAFEGPNWSLTDAATSAILEKMRSVGVPLDKYVKGGIRRGVLTGFNEAFVINSKKRDELIAKEPKSTEIIKPLIIGDDIRRYCINFRERYLIWTYIGVPIERYPAILNHLEKYEVQLKRRLDKGQHWWELRACNYYEDFEKAKVVWGAFALEGRFVLDRDGMWVNAPAYFVPRDDPYLVAALSSRLGFFCLSHLCSVLGDASRGGRAVVRTAYIRPLPIRRVFFTTSAKERDRLIAGLVAQYNSGNFTELLAEVNALLPQDEQNNFLAFAEGATGAEEKSDVVHDLLVYLAQQMIDLHKERQRLEREADLFRFVDRDIPCLRLDKALGGPLGAGEMIGDLSAVRHDIEGLRLSQEKDSRWLLEVRGKLRDPESDWREHQRDKEGNFIRQWLSVYHLPLDEVAGRFYHYAFAHLGGFDGAGKFPGGYTSTTLEKLKATKIPKFVPVDLAPLATLEAELAEVRRKIRLTDDLIDQIVYRLYGLTEEEIAIVEGRA